MSERQGRIIIIIFKSTISQKSQEIKNKLQERKEFPEFIVSHTFKSQAAIPGDLRAPFSLRKGFQLWEEMKL